MDSKSADHAERVMDLVDVLSKTAAVHEASILEVEQAALILIIKAHHCLPEKIPPATKLLSICELYVYLSEALKTAEITADIISELKSGGGST